MLFQATSSELVDAYSHVPYPHGTVLAADVYVASTLPPLPCARLMNAAAPFLSFASGIMGSDTDFGVFETYLDTVGLDMAVVGVRPSFSRALASLFTF